MNNSSLAASDLRRSAEAIGVRSGNTKGHRSWAAVIPSLNAPVLLDPDPDPDLSQPVISPATLGLAFGRKDRGRTATEPTCRIKAARIAPNS